MFNNIGGKIKILASFVAWLGIIGSIIGGAITFLSLNDSYYTEDFAWIGIIVAIVGAVASWIGSFWLYGFGELIEQTGEINTNISDSKAETELNAKIQKLKQWKDQGLITDAEFIQKINSL